MSAIDTYLVILARAINRQRPLREKVLYHLEVDSNEERIED